VSQVLNKFRKLDPKLQIGVAVLWCVLLLAGGWMLLVTPQKTKAADLAQEAESTQAQIDQNRQLAALQSHPTEQIRVADLFKLTKAMPNQEDMAGVILQLSRAAEASGIRFTSITPADQVVDTAFTKRNLQIAFIGNFYGLSDFLFRVRNLVTVRGGELQATGRLFNIESIHFDEGPDAFPQIQATLSMDVYQYGAPTAPVTAAPVVPPAASTDTTATTTSSGGDSTGDIPPAGAAAAGASG
jgi:Tfp pilus assembly protein PilO